MHVCVLHLCLVPKETRKGSPRTAVAESCEPPCEYWELNARLIEE